jgi:hypothetical protein
MSFGSLFSLEYAGMGRWGLNVPHIFLVAERRQVLAWDVSPRGRNPIKPRVAERRQVYLPDCQTHAVALRLR